MKRPVFQVLASLACAYQNCVTAGNDEWRAKHRERFTQVVRDFLPSGSGWDNGTHFDIDTQSGERLQFTGGFHHMDEHGSYAGWTEHAVTVRPSLQFGFTVTISGRDRNSIKEYLSELFEIALRQEIEQEQTEPYAYKVAK